MEVSHVRRLESTQCQLSFPSEYSGEMQRVWESFGPEVRERVLRVLASVIGRVVSASEQERR
jgi:hypothetical protein